MMVELQIISWWWWWGAIFKRHNKFFSNNINHELVLAKKSVILNMHVNVRILSIFSRFTLVWHRANIVDNPAKSNTL